MRNHSFVRLAIVFAIAAVLTGQFAWADYKQAYAEYNKKNFPKAIQELKQDLEQNPDYEFGHRLLGLCYLNLNDNAMAINSFTRAVALKSTAFATFYGLGQAYFNMQQYDKCINALNQGEQLAAKEKEPEKARLFKVRGAAYYRTNQFSEAAEDLTSAIRFNQSDWADFSMLGISYFKLNRIDEAIPAMEKALAMKPGQTILIECLSKAYLKKGASFLSAKQYPAAMQSLWKAKDYDPNNGYIYYNMAEASLFDKKYPDAEKALVQAATLLPKSPEVFARMGLVYEKQKKWDPALNAYKKADQISPSKEYKDAIARVTENKKR